MADLLETVQAIYGAFGRGDVPAILSYLHDDVAWESWADNTAARAGVPWMQARRGRAGAGEFFALVFRDLKVRDFQVRSMMAGPSQVAVEVVIEAEVAATGRVYRDEEIQLWTFDDQGRVTRLRHYLDTAKHIAAAG